MKPLLQAIVSIGLVVGSVTSADACCLWPFCGWWGAGYAPMPAYGYAPAPAYGNYTAGYPSFGAPAYGGYYSAGYAPVTDCCVPSCCSPCSSCGTGSCASGSCAGSPSSGTGSLKPANDPNFRNGTQKDEYDGKDRSREGLDSPADDLPPFKAPERSKLNDSTPKDDFDSLPIGGGRSDGGLEPFGADPDGLEQIKNKPPMPDATELPAVEPEDGKTFLPGETAPPEGQTQLKRQRKSVADRSSGLNEVLVPKRLASRSLPSPGSQKATSRAGKSNGDKSQAGTPVRWISVPRPDGQVRL